MVFIIIPVFNRLSFTIECIESLQKQKLVQYRIVVIDDGSTDGTSEYIQSHFPEVILINGNGHLWWTAATNEGIRYAMRMADFEKDFILTLNNDLVVKENYLQNLLDTYNSNKPCLVGSMSVDLANKKEIHFAGTRWNSHLAKYQSAIELSSSVDEIQLRHDAINSDLLPGRGTLIPIQLFKKVGLYDAHHFPQYMADEDFSLRCRKHGYNLLISTGAIVYNHVYATGLSNLHQKKNWKYWKDLFSSRRSPNNIRTRWNWARKHSALPPVYFLMDCSRIIYSKITKGI